MKYAFLIIAIVALPAAGCNEGTTSPTVLTPAASDRAAIERDNSGVNVRDRSEAALTPIDQNENVKDIDITASIRKRVVDTEMSVNAQNVKIVTQDGKVTLRGPVRSADEKTQIEELANQVAGKANVVNQLEVQPSLFLTPMESDPV